MRVEEIVNETRTLLRLNGWTQQRLADDADVHINTIKKINNPSFSCNSNTLSKLERVLIKEGRLGAATPIPPNDKTLHN
tara:strand:+ start:246 stop:482 length:237 start_codon:yes stop_codon:yes gene_type:complete